MTLSIFLLAALTLLAIGGPLRSAASGAARAITSPFVSVVHGVTKPIGEAFAGMFNYSDVVAQNHVLQHELGQLRQVRVEAAFKDRQLKDMLALAQLPFLSSLPFTTAQATTQNLSNFAATIQIDKGSASGVLPGMPVVADGGLVGIVTATTSGGSTVTLITDASRRIGVTFGTPGYVAVVQGQGAYRDLDAEFSTPGTPVHVGEVFYTNGLQGGLFPPGIPVGVVANSTDSRGATGLSITVHPLADLRHLSYVNVVLWEPTT